MGKNMLKKLIHRWRVKRILENKYLNRRLRCLSLLELINGEDILRERFNSMMNLKIAVLYTSIAVYTKKIKEINYQLDRKALISSDILSSSATVIAFDAFFTDQNNYYVESNTSFDKFKKECTRMLTLLEEADDAEYGYFEHTNRMLTNVLLNIEDVLVKIAVSLRE